MLAGGGLGFTGGVVESVAGTLAAPVLGFHVAVDTAALARVADVLVVLLAATVFEAT